jgi:hypothetical protein
MKQAAPRPPGSMSSGCRAVLGRGIALALMLVAMADDWATRLHQPAGSTKSACLPRGRRNRIMTKFRACALGV